MAAPTYADPNMAPPRTGPVVMPPNPPPAQPQPSSMPSFQPDSAMQAQQPNLSGSPSYQEPEMSPSSFTSGFAPEAISNPGVRETFAPQIAQDLEQNRNAAQAGFRNAGLAMRRQRLQDEERSQALRQKQAGDKADLEQRNTAAEQDMIAKGILYKKMPDGSIQALADEKGQPRYKAIAAKDAPVEYDEATGKPFQTLRDSAGGTRQIDPDAASPLVPWQDDAGQSWIVKQNKYSGYEYTKPEDALNSDDPRMQINGAKILHERALTDAATGVQNINESLDGKGYEQKLSPKAMSDKKEQLKEYQDTLNAGPPKPTPAGWFTGESPPTEEAISAYNEAKDGAASIQEHLGLLQQRDQLSEKARTLKQIGPAGFLKSYRASQIDTSDLGSPASGAEPEKKNDADVDFSSDNPSDAVQSPSIGPVGQPSQAAASTSLRPTFYDNTIGALTSAFKQGDRDLTFSKDYPTREAQIGQLERLYQNPPPQVTQTWANFPARFAGGMASDAGYVGASALATGAIGAAAGLPEGGVGAIPGFIGGAGIGARTGFGLAEGVKAKAETLAQGYAAFRKQGLAQDEAYNRALTIANLSGVLTGAVNTFAPGVSKGGVVSAAINKAVPSALGKMVLPAAEKGLADAAIFGAGNVGAESVTQIAQKRSGMEVDPEQQKQDLWNAGASGAGVALGMHAIHGALDAAGNAYMNVKVGKDVRDQGINSAFVQKAARQFEALDASKLKPDQMAKAKESLLAPLNAGNRPLVEFQINNALEARKQIVASNRAATAHLPAPNPKLAGLTNAQLQGEVDGTNPTPHPKDPQPKFGQAPKDQVQAEIDRRQAYAEAIAKNAPVVDALVVQAQRRSDIGREAGSHPSGQALIDGVNRHNAALPAGMPKADLDMAQLASDISPKTDARASVQPHALGYLPLAHDLEAIKDPQDKAFAVNALKLLNGREHDPSAIAAHDPDEIATAQKDAQKASEKAVKAGGAPIPIPPVSHPDEFEARQTAEGNPVLTEKGLAKLRRLVPGVQSVLAKDGMPVTAQHLAEQQGKRDEKSPAKPDKKTAKTGPDRKGGTTIRRVAHLAGIEDDVLGQRLKNLQAGRDRLQKSIEAQEKQTGGVPDGLRNLAAAHDRAVAEHEQELAARKQQRQAPQQASSEVVDLTPEEAAKNEAAALKHPAQPETADKDGATVKFHAQDGTIHEGTVLGVSDRHYTIRDEHDGETKTVPFTHAIPHEQTEAETRPAPATVPEVQPAGKEAVGPGPATEQGSAEKAGGAAEVAGQPESAGAKDGGIELPGIPGDIAPEHRAAGKLVSDLYAKMRHVAEALGITGFEKADHAGKSFGLAVNLNDPTKIQIDLASLTDNLAKLGAKEGAARLQLVLDHELRHVALEKAAGGTAEEANATFEDIWNKASELQQKTAIDLYEKGADSLLQPDRKEGSGVLSSRSASVKGREYMRMISALHANGRTDELSKLFTPESRSLLQKLVDYLKQVLTVSDPEAKRILADAEALLKAADKKEETKPPDKPTARTILAKELQGWNPETFKSRTDNSLEDQYQAMNKTLALYDKQGKPVPVEMQKKFNALVEERQYRDMAKQAKAMDDWNEDKLPDLGAAPVPSGQEPTEHVHSTYERDIHTGQPTHLGNQSGLSQSGVGAASRGVETRPTGEPGSEESFPARGASYGGDENLASSAQAREGSGQAGRSLPEGSREELRRSESNQDRQLQAQRRDHENSAKALQASFDHFGIDQLRRLPDAEEEAGSEGTVVTSKWNGTAYKYYHKEPWQANGLAISHLHDLGDGLRIATKPHENRAGLAGNLDTFRQIPGWVPFEVHGVTNKGHAVVKMPFLPGYGNTESVAAWERSTGAVRLPDTARTTDVNVAFRHDNYVVIGKNGAPYLLADVNAKNFRKDSSGKSWLVDAIPHKIGNDELSDYPELKEAFDKAMVRFKGRDGGRETLGASPVPTQREFSEKALGFTGEKTSKLHPDIQAIGKNLSEAWDSMRKTWAPQLRSKEAGFTGRSLSAHVAEMDRAMNIEDHAMKQADAYFGRKTEAENLPALFDIDEGTLHSPPEQHAFIAHMRELNVKVRDDLRSMSNSHFKAFLVHYLPHIFIPEDVQAAKNFFENKIEGSRSFLKHRTIPTLREALAWEKPDGTHLRLISHNPVELFKTRWSQMHKYQAGQMMIKDLTDAGIAHKFEKESEIPAGNRQVDDRLGLSTEPLSPEEEAYSRTKDKNGKINKPNYKTVHLYAPDSVVDLLDNHLSPGLRDKAVYKVINGAANTLNQFQLGFSAFHLGFTTNDVAVSKLAYGLEEIFRKGGDLTQGAKAIASVPFQYASPLHLLAGYVKPNWDTHIGSRISKEMDMPGSQGAEIAALAHMAVQGGMSNKMDPFYANQMVKSYLREYRAGNKFAAAWRFPLAAVEAASRPIMEYIVPRQKLAVFADLARMEMRKLGPNATMDDVRAAMQKAGASVDNRMGQLRYDNLYWNKTAKDLAMITVRSVGWNLGSYRELLGGLGDYGKGGYKILSGKTQEAEFTHKMAYTAALPLMMGSMGALINYLYTGQAPQEMRDYFFPKTGEKDGNGHNIRLALPSYMKDVYGTIHQPGKTLANKLNPIWSSLLMAYNNKDFYGTEVVHPDDNKFMQAAELLGFSIKQLAPFAVTGAQRLAQQGASPAKLALPFFGLTPAAGWIDKSAAEIKAQEINEAEMPSGAKTQEQADKAQKKALVMQQLEANDPIKGGSSAKFGQILRQAVEQGVIPRKEIDQTIRRSRMTPLERQFHGMRYDDAVKVWNLATRQEKQKLLPMFREKLTNAREKGETVDNSLLKLSN